MTKFRPGLFIPEPLALVALDFQPAGVTGLSCAVIEDGKLLFLFDPGTRCSYSG